MHDYKIIYILLRRYFSYDYNPIHIYVFYMRKPAIMADIKYNASIPNLYIDRLFMGPIILIWPKFE